MRSFEAGNVQCMKKRELGKSSNFTCHNVPLECNFECMMFNKVIHMNGHEVYHILSVLAYTDRPCCSIKLPLSSHNFERTRIHV